jgi:hypothetical protein
LHYYCCVGVGQQCMSGTHLQFYWSCMVVPRCRGFQAVGCIYMFRHRLFELVLGSEIKTNKTLQRCHAKPVKYLHKHWYRTQNWYVDTNNHNLREWKIKRNKVVQYEVSSCQCLAVGHTTLIWSVVLYSAKLFQKNNDMWNSDMHH